MVEEAHLPIEMGKKISSSRAQVEITKNAQDTNYNFKFKPKTSSTSIKIIIVSFIPQGQGQQCTSQISRATNLQQLQIHFNLTGGNMAEAPSCDLSNLSPPL